MKKIKLNKGYFALVDNEDFEFLNKSNWSVNYGYAVRLPYKGREARMHRLILGLIKNDGKVTDHINRNRLDNRKCNLRILTRVESPQNRGVFNNTKKFKGVIPHHGR